MARPSWRGAAIVVSASLLVLGALPGAGQATPTPESQSAAHTAAAWLVDQQVAAGPFAGSFEVAGSPGFETPDALLAIAAAAQTTDTWSAAEALAAVQALPHDALHWLDDWVDGTLALDPVPTVGAGEAAKLVVLVVAPLGLDAHDFDPDADSPTPVDLLTRITGVGGCATDPDPLANFNETMYVVLARTLLCGAPNAKAVAAVRAGQRSDGGWNYVPDQDPATVSDPDTTGLAVQALVASGARWDDPAVRHALEFLAAGHRANGAWQTPDFVDPTAGLDSPNSTALATFAVRAAGFDPASSCWRDTVLPTTAGTPYVDSAAWLRSVQDPDGHVVGPFDGFGLNTSGTSQAVEALLLRWLPIVAASGAPDCHAVEPDVAPAFTG